MYHQLYFLPPLSCFHAHLLALSHLWDMVVCTELNCPLRNKPDCYTPEFAVVSLLLDCIIHHLSHSSFHSALRLTWFNRFSNCLRNLHSCWSRKCIFFPYCCPEERFDLNENVFSLWPVPHCYIIMRARGTFGCVGKLRETKSDCCTPPEFAVVCSMLDCISASCCILHSTHQVGCKDIK